MAVLFQNYIFTVGSTWLTGCIKSQCNHDTLTIFSLSACVYRYLKVSSISLELLYHVACGDLIVGIFCALLGDCCHTDDLPHRRRRLSVSGLSQHRTREELWAHRAACARWRRRRRQWLQLVDVVGIHRCVCGVWGGIFFGVFPCLLLTFLCTRMHIESALIWYTATKGVRRSSGLGPSPKCALKMDFGGRTLKLEGFANVRALSLEQIVR